MTVAERIKAIRLLEKQEKNPEYVERLGIQIHMVKKASEKTEK